MSSGEKSCDPPCRFLQWDSDFFGCRVAAVNGERLNPEQACLVDAWCRANGIECLYFLCDATDIASIRCAERSGFGLVEVRLIFERFLRDVPSGTRPRSLPENIVIRPACRADLPAFRNMVPEGYTTTRYCLDSGFPPEKVRDYYQTWITRCFEGRANHVLTAEVDGDPVGYVVGSICSDPTQGILELGNVEQEAQGKGLGFELFHGALEWLAQHGVKRVTGTTQGANMATQRLLQRMGFLTSFCGLYYHKWFTR